MFDRLADKLSDAFQRLRGRGKLTESDLKDALREVRLALLEADVNYKVVKDFLEAVRQRAVGREVMASLTPGQQVVKIVYEELTLLMGGQVQGLSLTGRSPWPVMLVGLQGSGKTTTCGKLALWLKKQGRRPFLVPADVNRPAAITQLTRLAEEVGVPVYPSVASQDPVEIAAKAMAEAGPRGCDVVLIDTAGRLAIDEPLMEELARIKAAVSPPEILFVADSMTGQEAVNIAQAFDRRLDLTGVVLTKTEGDARGGAAMSIKAVTGKPLKFMGVGEKLEALEPFHPDRVASLILGMGDVLSLIEKAQETVDAEEALKLAGKIKKGDFTLEDFRSQLNQLNKMGSLESILGLIPGLGKLKKLREAPPDAGEMKKIQAIIDSMTIEERRDHTILDASRRRRIARGSGSTVADVNQMIKNFVETKKMMRKFTKSGFLRGGFPFG